jgi:hypothetical protein
MTDIEGITVMDFGQGRGDDLFWAEYGVGVNWQGHKLKSRVWQLTKPN